MSIWANSFPTSNDWYVFHWLQDNCLLHLLYHLDVILWSDSGNVDGICISLSEMVRSMIDLVIQLEVFSEFK